MKELKGYGNNKSPEIQALMSRLSVTDDPAKCPTCGGDVGGFRDSLSRREYSISGMCQDCQDKVFGR